VLCPICNNTVSRAVSGSIFYFKEQECQRCGSQWTPAYSRLRIGVFVVLCFAVAAIALYVADSVWIHGRWNDVREEDKPIPLTLSLVSMAAGSWGLLHTLLLLRTPRVQISRTGVWPPSPVAAQSGGTVVQPNVKSNEGRGATE
jgi:hypothetical protein